MIISKIYYPQKNELTPPKKLFFLRAGFHGKKNTMTSRMRDILNEMYIEGMKIAEGIVYYQTFSVGELSSLEIPQKFDGIKRLTYFCSSIGMELDKKVEYYQKNDEILKASLLDAWGSESVEEINEQFDRKLRKIFGKGTMRFSPGYGEISLIENIKVLELLDVKKITAHPKSGVLIPVKSTVCMIGWYSGDTVEEK